MQLNRPGHVPEGLWEAYQRTRVEIDLLDGSLMIGPSDDAPAQARAHLPLYVVTAWTPNGERSDAAANAARHKELVDRVVERGLEHWPARGHSADDPSHEAEEGLAIAGLQRPQAIAWGAGFDQLAIFEISDNGLAVIPVPPRLSERPIHYLWTYDPNTDRLEISRDYARSRRHKRGHRELEELMADAAQLVQGYAYPKPLAYRITDVKHDPVGLEIGKRVASAVRKLEIREGFILDSSREIPHDG